jgi:hypothetical protein
MTLRATATQTGVEGFVGDAHGAPAQLPQAPVFSLQNFVMLVALSVRHFM